MKEVRHVKPLDYPLKTNSDYQSTLSININCTHLTKWIFVSYFKSFWNPKILNG